MRSISNFIMLIVCTALLLPSCFQRRQATSRLSSLIENRSSSSFKHFDVPIPLTFTISNQLNNNTLKDWLHYEGNQPVKNVISFYNREMESNGWRITDLSIEEQGFLFCTKPGKQCGIIINQALSTKNKQTITHVQLFISPKTTE